uniref:Uncharacterized protein n=1 Tax=Macaca fascicularis TaxID=9541 RepID=A0A7N9DEQ9_MACFA
LCWQFTAGLISQKSILTCLRLCRTQKKGSRVHVHNVQVCYICIHVPYWCAAPINSSFLINSFFSSV